MFQGFSWTARAGEAWAVIGPSGCGKSTLLYLIAGLRQPSAGHLLVDGSPVPRPRASTGLILQDYGLLPWATVWENVALPMRMGQFYRDKPGPAMGRGPYPRPDITPDQVTTGWSGWASPSCGTSTPARSAAASASARPSPAACCNSPTCC